MSRLTKGWGPVGWVVLQVGNGAVFTIRWKRGEPIAYVYPGRQMYQTDLTQAADTFPVPDTGWTDHEHIRASGRNWYTELGRRQRRQRDAKEAARLRAAVADRDRAASA